MKKDITVIGSANIDLIMKMERLPEKGETVTDAEFFEVFGGKGANQAIGATRAGGNVTLVAAVGDDYDTDNMLKSYENEGISTGHIFRKKDTPTGRALIMIGEEGNNYISVAPGANKKLSPSFIDEAVEVIENASIVVIQNEIPASTVSHVFDLTEPGNVPVLWNFAPTKNMDLRNIGKASILVLNEVEAAYLSGQSVKEDEDVKRAATRLLQYGIEQIIISLGKRGAYVHTNKVQRLIPGFSVEAVDTTAAGDIFCGSLAVALTEGKPIEEAVKFAHAASALSVTRMGAQPSAPSRSEVEEFIEDY